MFNYLIQQDAAINIWIGKQEKEVRNLTSKTTINEVILAIIKEEGPLVIENYLSKEFDRKY